MPPKRTRRSEPEIPLPLSAVPPQTNIPSLPQETIHHILSYLTTYDQGTLAACCLVSKQFDSIARPMLWKWIRLTPPSSSEPRKVNKDGGKNQSKTIDISRWSGELRNQVKTLSLPHHFSHWCSVKHARQLDLPNIKTLHLEMEQYHTWSISRIHKNGYDEPSNDLCPLLKALRPQTVVVWNVECHTIDDQCSNLPTRMWRDVNTILCVSPSLTPNFEIYNSKAFRFGRLARVIWIFHPRSFSSPNDGIPRRPLGYARHRIDIKLLPKLVSKFPGIPITIVNVGSNHRYGLYDFPNWRYLDNTEDLTSEEIFRKNFGGSKEEQELITFRTLPQFFEEEDCGEWFDAKDMKEWIDMMDKLEKEDEARRGGSVIA